MGSLFAAFLGYNPIAELLGPSGTLHQPGVDRRCSPARSSSPELISGTFDSGLVVVFTVAAVMMAIGAAASRGNPGCSNSAD